MRSIEVFSKSLRFELKTNCNYKNEQIEAAPVMTTLLIFGA